MRCEDVVGQGIPHGIMTFMCHKNMLNAFVVHLPYVYVRVRVCVSRTKICHTLVHRYVGVCECWCAAYIYGCM